jgi:ADP-ribose pyrophosphatase YjhB (NUDIX family)
MIWTPHITVATVVEQEGRFLLVEETEDNRTVFNQPAGHLDEEESLFDAAVRETLEESAWHVTLTDYLGVYVYKAPNTITYVRHCFVARPERHDPALTLDEGIIATHWLSADEIMADNFPARSPLVATAVKDYLNGVRLPLESVNHHS